MKVKAKLKKDVIKVKALIKHDMITYDQAKKKFGDREKSNFVMHVTAKIGDAVIYDASTSQFLSKNPILKFQAKGDKFKKGDKLTMNWVDRSGATKEKTVKLK